MIADERPHTDMDFTIKAAESVAISIQCELTSFFTALHRMQTRSSVAMIILYVRLSVRLSVKRVNCDKTE